MMNNCLIGHTGFVGHVLSAQAIFAYKYNSKNFNDMKNMEFDEVVCAGVSAVKWLANKEPEQDKKRIKELQDILSTITAKHFILLSTVDVYPLSCGLDESFDCHSMNNHIYGRHRLEFEDFCKEMFKNCTIIRLPGLFGKGLKKNVIYDLVNNNCLEMININSSFQYYDLSNLWNDIQKIKKNGVKLINLLSEPVSTNEIVNCFFSEKAALLGSNPTLEVHYDLHTLYAELWGNKDAKYTYTREYILSQMEAFIKKLESEKNQ